MTASNMRPELDAWLSEADDLLSEQRAHHLPGEPHVDEGDPQCHFTKTVCDVEAEMETLLARHLAHLHHAG
jgi:hypothetical protein